MNKLRVTLFSFALSLFVSADSAASQLSEGYSCTTLDSVGFVYQDGSWKATRFDVRGDSFVIRKIREGDRGILRGKVGEDYAIFRSKKATYADAECKLKNDNLSCLIMSGGELDFSPETRRFNQRGTLGYWLLDDEKTGMRPYTSIGNCHAL